MVELMLVKLLHLVELFAECLILRKGQQLLQALGLTIPFFTDGLVNQLAQAGIAWPSASGDG